jgi:hypothetical protein
MEEFKKKVEFFYFKNFYLILGLNPYLQVFFSSPTIPGIHKTFWYAEISI